MQHTTYAHVCKPTYDVIYQTQTFTHLITRSQSSARVL